MAKASKSSNDSQEPNMRRRTPHGVFLAQLAIPAKLRSAYGGKQVLEVSTGEDSFKLAKARKDSVVEDWKREFLELEVGGVFTPEALANVRESMKPGADATRLAFDRIRQARMRDTLEWLKDKPYRDDGDVQVRLFAYDLMPDAELGKALRAQGLAPTPDLIRTAATVIDEADTGARNLYDRGRDMAPQSSEEPIDSLLDTYFAENHFRQRQQDSKRKAVKTFTAWLKEKRMPATIGRVSKGLAGEFVTARLVPGERGPKAVNNELSALSAYWKFLIQKDRATGNPFEGQSLKRNKVQLARIKKRPFTTNEMVDLLTGDPASALKDKTGKVAQMVADAIRLLASHGLRAEELAQLRVGDCKGGLLRVYGGVDPHKVPKWHEHNLGKNESARRTIPWNPEAADLIKGRMKDKPDEAYLIHELTTPSNPKWERSQRLEKFFRDYRRAIGVDDHTKGQKQSRIDMHSLRRFYAKAAQKALEAGATGFTPWTIADVIGHDSGSSLPLGMTMKDYPGKSDIASMRECMKAVKLPTARVKEED